MCCVLSFVVSDPVVPRLIKVSGPGVSVSPTPTRGGVIFYFYFTNMLRAIQGKWNSFLGFKLVSLARPPLGGVLLLWVFMY